MSFQRQIDPQLAHGISLDAAALPSKITILALPTTTIFAKIGAALSTAWKNFGKTSRLPSVNSLSSHLRQDIGISTSRDISSRGYY